MLLLWVMEDTGSDSAKVFSGHYRGSSWGLRAGPVSVPQPGTGPHTHQALPWGWSHGWAGPGGACSRAVCRDLETGPALALLVQELMAPRVKMGSWAMGKFGERPRRPGQDL